LQAKKKHKIVHRTTSKKGGREPKAPIFILSKIIAWGSFWFESPYQLVVFKATMIVGEIFPNNLYLK